MIELDLELPLASFALRVAARLEGGVTAVMGPSGSGKTSLLEAIAGLRRGARGRVALDGAAAARHRDAAWSLPPEARRVGYVPQDAGLFPHLTARANVRFGARADAAAVASAIDDARDRPAARALSRPRSRAARSSAWRSRARSRRGPRLLLLDEPLAALDVGLRERILPYLMRVRDEWKTPVLYVTHNVGEALALAGQRAAAARRARRGGRARPSSCWRRPAMVRGGRARRREPFAGRVRAHDAEGGVTSVELAAGQGIAVPLAAALAPGQPRSRWPSGPRT